MLKRTPTFDGVKDEANVSVQDLQAEIARLNKVVDALVSQAERQAEGPRSAYGLFQSTVVLEDQVRARTHELEVSLQRNERISHDLQVANEKIEESEKLFRNILEFAPIGMCIAGTGFRYQMVNKAFCDMMGYTREELVGLTPYDITHPDDLDSSRLNMEHLMEGAIDSYQMQNRYIRKDGSTVWVAITTSSLRDAAGAPAFLIGQVQDITERKHSEEQLRLAAAVYHHSSQAMMITDAASRIVATNPAFTELTGYKAEDVLGRDPKLLASGRQGKDFYESMWQSLSVTGHWEGELWNRKKSGELYAEWLSISIVRDDKGAVQNYIALSTDVTEKKKAAELIWEHANFDSLTKLPNRRLFRDRLEQDLSKAARARNGMALLFIDLDHFKEVNDTLGHQFGDELLVQVANRLKAQVRASDTVARMGGDEFTAILGDISTQEDAGRIAQSLVNALAQTFDVLGHEVHVSGSIGIALYPGDALNAEELIKGADDAMYQSKNKGRNRFTYFSQPHASRPEHK
jgi:diguanylate cyclase (GGDEF)-like protein/PAS domain S-box-containing protein